METEARPPRGGRASVSALAPLFSLTSLRPEEYNTKMDRNSNFAFFYCFKGVDVMSGQFKRILSILLCLLLCVSLLPAAAFAEGD